MAVYLDLGKDAAHDARLVDDERRALDAHEFAAVERFHFVDAVELADFVAGIGEQGEVQVVLRDELAVRVGRVAADANDLG